MKKLYFFQISLFLVVLLMVPVTLYLNYKGLELITYFSLLMDSPHLLKEGASYTYNYHESGAWLVFIMGILFLVGMTGLYLVYLLFGVESGSGYGYGHGLFLKASLILIFTIGVCGYSMFRTYSVLTPGEIYVHKLFQEQRKYLIGDVELVELKPTGSDDDSLSYKIYFSDGGDLDVFFSGLSPAISPYGRVGIKVMREVHGEFNRRGLVSIQNPGRVSTLPFYKKLVDASY
jgi:hypothetical protein